MREPRPCTHSDPGTNTRVDEQGHQAQEEMNKVAKLTLLRSYQSERLSWLVEGSVGSCDWFCLDAPPLSHTVTQQYRHQPRQPGEGRRRGGRGEEEGRRVEREERGERGGRGGVKQTSLRKGCNKKGKEYSNHQKQYLSLCKAGVLFTVDLLVLQEETLGLVGTLEVVVGSAPTCTTPHSRINLTTHITMLEGKRKAWFKKHVCTCTQ